ncbi:hypothetical protein [Methylomonas fluvii]|uniref:Uncharacterized protein n=1 Tax=Methylomonas fluvii TaxID=1854564 RepID=A0ABR9D830_9GAMM|nr:hypothetical protein [Methylomonas fluvii]MBD9359270.1 hypothetical protein [Methylomonas fluvii]
MTIQLHHFELTKAQLNQMPEPERNLLVMLAHAANEISVLAKLFHFCSGNRSDIPVLERAENSQALLLGRLLTGKLYEFWNLLQTGYFASALSRTYDTAIDDAGRNALVSMRRYFGRDNLIARVRNHHAFHYDIEQIQNGFRSLADGEPLDIYLAQANANSLFAFADTIAGRAMLEAIAPGDPARAFSGLISETSRAVGWVNVVIGSLMVACLERNLGGNLYSLGARTIDIEGAPSSQVVQIPYFIEVAMGTQQSAQEGRAEEPRAS